MVIKHDELINEYKNMLDERNKQSILNITSNTGDVLSKSHPKSKIVTRYEEELFGLDPEEIKKLPIKSVEMLQQALQFLIQKAKEDPTVFQALRKLIRNAGDEVEEANPEAVEDMDFDVKPKSRRHFGESKEEMVIGEFKSLLSQLSEGKQPLTEATINYKALSTMKGTMAKKSASFKMFLDAFNLSIEGMTTQQLQGAVMFANQIGQQVLDNPELKAKFATLFTAEKAVQKKKEAPVESTSPKSGDDFESTFKESKFMADVTTLLEKKTLITEASLTLGFNDQEWQEFVADVKDQTIKASLSKIKYATPEGMVELLKLLKQQEKVIIPILKKHTKVLSSIQQVVKTNANIKRSADNISLAAKQTTGTGDDPRASRNK